MRSFKNYMPELGIQAQLLADKTIGHRLIPFQRGAVILGGGGMVKIVDAMGCGLPRIRDAQVGEAMNGTPKAGYVFFAVFVDIFFALLQIQDQGGPFPGGMLG
jgi:hypothetical protein